MEAPKVHSLTVNGYHIRFPFEPYECQIKIMSSMLSSFENGQNLILESPTGTGKCMSTLSACFAYLNNFNSLKKNKEVIKKFNEYKKLISELNELKKTIFYSNSKNKNNDNKKINQKEKKEDNAKLSNFSNNNKNNISNKLNKDSDLFLDWETKKDLNANLAKLDDEFNLEEDNSVSSSISRGSRNQEANQNPNKNQQQIKDLNFLILDFELIYNHRKNLQILFNHDKANKSSVNESKKKIQNAIETIKAKIFELETIPPTFIYCVRTSSQIDVVYDELKKSNELLFFQTAYLKSRNYHCLNKHINSKYKNDDLILACKKMQLQNSEENQCINLKNSRKFSNRLYDKDLVNYKAKRMCAYYSEIKKIENSQLIICNYNYVLQNRSIKVLENFVFNPIVIIDEAHNFLDALEANFNNQFTVKSFVEALDEIGLVYESLLEKRAGKISALEINNEEKINYYTFEKINEIFNLLLVFVKNIIYFNQSRSEADKAQSHSSNSVFEYRGYMIFKFFACLFSRDCFDAEISKGKAIKIYADYDPNFYWNACAKENFKNDVFERLKKDTVINYLNYKEVCNAIKLIEEEAFELEIKDKSALKKLRNFFSFFFENLFENFDRNIYLYNKTSAFIDDYFYIHEDEKVFNSAKDPYAISVNYRDLNDLADKIIKAPFLDLKIKMKKQEKIIDLINFKIGRIKNKKISLICLNPSLGFLRIKKIFGPRTIVNLMSGTLNPFDFYQFQLKTEFPLKLVTQHIIDERNVKILIFKEPLIKEICNDKKAIFYNKKIEELIANENKKVKYFNNLQNKNKFDKKYIPKNNINYDNKNNNLNNNNRNLNTQVYSDEEEFDINAIYDFISNLNEEDKNFSEHLSLREETISSKEFIDKSFISVSKTQSKNNFVKSTKAFSTIKRNNEKIILESLKFTYANFQDKIKKDLLMENLLKIIFDFSNICLTGNLVFMKSFDFVNDFKFVLKKSLLEAGIEFKEESYGNLFQIYLDDYDENSSANNYNNNHNDYNNCSNNFNLNGKSNLNHTSIHNKNQNNSNFNNNYIHFHNNNNIDLSNLNNLNNNNNNYKNNQSKINSTLYDKSRISNFIKYMDNSSSSSNHINSNIFLENLNNNQTLPNNKNTNIYNYKKTNKNNNTNKRKIFLFFDVQSTNNKIKSDLIEQYKESCEAANSKNFLFTVMRGTLSEGVNFKNNESTSVFIVGVPFASFKDPIVTIKRKYLDEKSAKKNKNLNNFNINNYNYNKNNNFKSNNSYNINNSLKGNNGTLVHYNKAICYSPSTSFSNKNNENSSFNHYGINKDFDMECPLNGSEWYALDAINCVNQAIGRSIRSKSDFANVIIIDEQFLDFKNEFYFSSWIKKLNKKIVGEENYFEAIKDIKLFLESNASKANAY